MLKVLISETISTQSMWNTMGLLQQLNKTFPHNNSRMWRFFCTNPIPSRLGPSTNCEQKKGMQ